MRKILLLITLFVSSFYCFSQVNLEPYASYIRNNNNEFRATTQGIGFRVELGRDDGWVTKYFGVAYAFPMYPTVKWEAHAYDSWTDPSFVDVTARYKQSMVRLEAGCKLYPIGRADKFKGFNWYFNAGLEGNYTTNKATYSYFDQEKYNLGFMENGGNNPDGTDKYALNIYCDLGSGMEIGIGPGNIFVHGSIAIPGMQSFKSSSGTSSDIESFAPVPININVGYKIPLGNIE